MGRRHDALREGAALLRAISDTSADVIFAKDRQGRMRFANPATLALIGKPVEAVLGKTDAEFLDDPEAARQVMENDRRIMESGVPEELEERVPLPDGSERVWSSRKSPYRDSSGAVVGLLGVSRDITARKRAEAALRRSEERYRALFTNMTEGFALGEIICDAAGAPVDFRLVEMNEAFERQSGLDREATRGRSIRAVLPNLEQSWIDAYGAVALGGEPRRFERHAGDLGRWFSVYCFSPAPGQFAILFTDVSERRRAEDALRESEARHRAFFHSVMELAGVHEVVRDASGAVVDSVVRDVNEPALRLIGRARAEVIGRRLGELVPPALVGALTAPWAAVLDGGAAARYEVEHEGHVLLVSATRMSADTIAAVADDITERKRAEEALRQADRRKDEFLGMLSHELRNPLAPIRNALYILDRAAPAGEQARRAKEVANRQLAHMTRLVDDLLDVTRIARGKIELRRTDLDLAALADRTAEDHRAIMHERRLELAVRLPSAPVMVNVDATRLAQVLGNLLQNAAKFTPEGGHVTLAVAEADDRAVIRVRDTGPGIAPEVLPTMFEPFTQGKQTLARTEGGLGLGLALVKGLVAMHGGEVRAKTVGEGGGAEFVVTLPLATPNTAATRDPEPVRRPPHGRRRVLVIDDNRDAADTVAELVGMLGHDVDVAYDAHDGLAKATGAVPDVVFCDLGLPGMDGYEFARRLRAVVAREPVRLVALSGYAQPEDVARAIEAGFDAHVAKPPDPEALAGMLG